MNNRIVSFLILALTLAGCHKGNEMRTASGMKYILHTHTEGKKPQAGDYVTVHMVYRNEKDSILHDTRTNGRPMRFQLLKPPFLGSMEEGLTYLSVGDSATFFISADSMYDKVVRKTVDSTRLASRPAKGSFLKFDVKLLRIQDYKEAEMDMAMQESHMIQAEQNALENYLKEKNITASLEKEGYYIIIESKGKGNLLDTGKVVQVNFTGRFLNGVVFDSNTKSGKPYNFVLGHEEVIKGWDIAFQKLHAGDKATLIIPSRLAYGKEGFKRPDNNSYIVPPFSTLIFEVEILDTKALTKK